MGGRIVDIQMDKIHPIAVFLLQPIHDGRNRLADVSTKAKEFDELQLARCQPELAKVAGGHIQQASV